MVTCTKCGTENEEGAKYCVNCGAVLSPEEKSEKGEDTRFERRVERRERRMEQECFGLPHRGAIAGVVFGAFIILIGIALAFGIDIGRWAGPYMVIVVGLLIVAGAIYGLSKRKG